MLAVGPGAIVTASFSQTLIIALVSSAGFWGILQWIMNRQARKEARTEAARKNQRDLDHHARVLAEAQEAAQRAALDSLEGAYNRVTSECSECRRKLEEVLKELADIKDVLIERLDAFDEILPYVQNLPDDKLRDLRAANRAVKMAVYRVRP